MKHLFNNNFIYYNYMNTNTVIIIAVSITCIILFIGILLATSYSQKKHVPKITQELPIYQMPILEEEMPIYQMPILEEEMPMYQMPILEEEGQTPVVEEGPIYQIPILEEKEPVPANTLMQPKPKQKPSPNVWITEHNRLRASVNQAPVKWNDVIASGAETYAKNCKFEHSNQATRKLGSTLLGENLGTGSPYNMYDEKKIFGLWEDEKQFYKYPQGPSGETGHYTQIINKNVTDIGCGCANCNGSRMCVCRYLPIQYSNQPPY